MDSLDYCRLPDYLAIVIVAALFNNFRGKNAEKAILKRPGRIGGGR
jgi:hypothetical protein